jgi:hypothetical protein
LILVNFNPLKDRTQKFSAVFDYIVGELQARFGDRLSRADAEHYLKARNTLPISDAARAFHRKIIDSRLKAEPPPNL